MGRITIKDIAKLLEVNPSTVSRALKDHPDISLETRKMVKRVAEELGYSPNIQAISFRNRKSKLIGLILPDMNMFFFPSVFQSIEEEVRKRGYHLVVLHSSDLLEREIENVNFCQSFGVDGILVSLSKETANVNHFNSIIEKGIPVVFFDKVLQGQDNALVIIQDEVVSEKAVRHLIKNGRRRICGLFGNPNLTISKLRYAGFANALKKAGLDVVPEFIIFANDIDQTRSAMLTIFQNPKPPDAVFAMSDELLVGTMEAVNICNLKIPEEVSIISISDGQAPYFYNPPITHVEHSGKQVGKKAAELLFEIIDNKYNASKQKIILDTHLVIQKST